MHHDFFAWVRLLLLIILILGFAVWVNTVEPYIDQPEEPAQEEQTYFVQATPLTVTPLKAEKAPEPTLHHPMEEITPPTEAATIATEPPTEPPTEPETEPTEPVPTYTNEELEMLAIVIYQEAGGDNCSDFTRLGVGTVVMNRVGDPRYPNTLYKVLTQEVQYGRMHWTGVVWPERASDPNEAHAVERAYIIATRILAEGVRVFDADVVYQAEFPQGTEIVAYSDGMYFCR